VDYNRDTVKHWAGNSQFRALRAELARFRSHGYSGWGSEGFWALAIYRLQRSVLAISNRYVRAVPAVLLYLLRKIFVIATGVDLNPRCEIGPGLLIPHGAQIRIIEYTKIGSDCTIGHLSTIGAGTIPGHATIGDHVYISCHVCILGPVDIGEGATIAASSLVISNVPAGHTAIGVPAKILPTVKDRRFGYSNIPMQKNVDPARVEE
jgi:serine O-acetyltransferase